MKDQKKILLIEHTWPEFINSRLKLGVSLIEKDIDVHALLPNQKHVEEYRNKIEAAGLTIYTYDYEKNTTSLFSNLNFVKAFRDVFKKNQYDIIHSFKFQPNLYTILASLFSVKSKIVLHITGLGIVFAKPSSFKKRLYKFISRCIFLFNFILADKIIFQNDDDEDELWLTKFFKNKTCVIEGSGVDTKRFDRSIYNPVQLKSSLKLENRVVISFISRLVYAKGVRELINTVEDLSEDNPKLILLIVGTIDKDNPDSLTKEFIDKFKDHSNIRFLGYRKDTAEILSITDIYAYPSYYREGVPRTVLEALSTGIPIITTDMPGCKLTIENDKNGYLIEPRSEESLKIALTKIINNKNKAEMGSESRRLALSRFSNTIIYNKIYNVYYQFVK